VSGEYTPRALDLVARELWWRQENAEYPPDKERWRTAAAALPIDEFYTLLRATRMADPASADPEQGSADPASADPGPGRA
jgi:hypothetical protein